MEDERLAGLAEGVVKIKGMVDGNLTVEMRKTLVAYESTRVALQAVIMVQANHPSLVDPEAASSLADVTARIHGLRREIAEREYLAKSAEGG